jgi:hypothetical protein
MPIAAGRGVGVTADSRANHGEFACAVPRGCEALPHAAGRGDAPSIQQYAGDAAATGQAALAELELLPGVPSAERELWVAVDDCEWFGGAISTSTADDGAVVVHWTRQQLAPATELSDERTPRQVCLCYRLLSCHHACRLA